MATSGGHIRRRRMVHTAQGKPNIEMRGIFMRSNLFKIPCITLVATFVTASHAFAADGVERVGNTGASGIWILANISYAGMRAQGSRSTGWRIVAFIFGFPGTFITWLVVDENSERAYGVELPRKDSRAGSGDGPRGKGSVIF